MPDGYKVETGEKVTFSGQGFFSSSIELMYCGKYAADRYSLAPYNIGTYSEAATNVFFHIEQTDIQLQGHRLKVHHVIDEAIWLEYLGKKKK